MTKKQKHIAAFFFLFFLPAVLFSAHTRDSLLFILKNKMNRCNPQVYQQLAATYYPENTDSSIHYLLAGAKEAHDCRLFSGEAACYRAAGAQSFLRSDYENAMAYYNRSIEIYEKYSRNNELAEAYRGLGLCYFDQGQYTKSIIEYHKGLKVAEEFKDTISKGRLINSIGSSFEMMGDYSNALAYYNDGLNIRIMMNDSSGMATSYMNVGNMLTRKKEKEKAMQSYSLALSIGESLENKYIIINALVSLAASQGEFGMIEEAEKSWLLALEKSEGEDYLIQRTEIYNGLADIYLQRKRNKDALVYSELAIDLSKKINAKNELKRSVFSKAEALHRLGRANESYQAIKEYALLQDSLYKNENLFTAQELRVRYEKEKDARTISELKFQNDIEKIKSEKEATVNRVFTVVIIIMIPLLFVLVYLFLKNRKSSVLLRKSLHEKEVLLKEVHHRVKNNFQLISSLINLQGSMIEDENAVAALNNSKSRILSMALVHEFIYKAENLERINMDIYITRLSEMIVRSFNESATPVSVTVKANNIEFGIETVIPLGLVINELVTNSVKYAFTGKSNGEITLELEEISPGKFRFRYTDNGKGLPADFDINKLNSLGMELVQLLAVQLKGELFVLKSEKGVVFELIFHLHD